MGMYQKTNQTPQNKNIPVSGGWEMYQLSEKYTKCLEKFTGYILPKSGTFYRKISRNLVYFLKPYISPTQWPPTQNCYIFPKLVYFYRKLLYFFKKPVHFRIFARKVVYFPKTWYISTKTWYISRYILPKSVYFDENLVYFHLLAPLTYNYYNYYYYNIRYAVYS